MGIADDRKRIPVTLTTDQYNQVKRLAARDNISMSEMIRKFVDEGLNGRITQDNLEFIIPIIREQVKDIVEQSVSRLNKMTAKTCIQAGSAAYLCAETINKFVPAKEQEDFLQVYESARKKAVKYMQGNSESE